MRATGAALACLCAGLAAAPGAAGAQTGGGAQFEESPAVKKVACVKACAKRKRPRAGSTLRLRGSGLSGVTTVIFQGVPGAEDDVRAPVTRKSAASAWVVVPAGAASGPLVALNQTGRRSKASAIVSLLPPPPPSPNPTLTPVPGVRQDGAPALETGTSRVKVFFGARRAVTFSYRVTDGVASGLQVQLVRVADGSVVRTWAPAPPALGTVASVVWNGDLAGKKAAPAGRYAFRLTASAGSGAVARSAQTSNVTRDSFDLYQDQFPIRGPHKYEGGLGDGRGHQGQDIFAKCGTPLVAARGGKVKTKAYQSRAGNYLVIDGDGTGNDYAYMHMAAPSPFEEGDRVYTGQQIGQVGQTGRASGCHLHFEAWSAPGWYSGGRVMNPTPLLKAWDAYS
ncbi:MAG TPA: peptidoglycan DD-metalloendopeptidase family protein [Thermoleophilaceae bacterium]|nr:peptidoglycan DD-metalloendopeptidase family protein [Thermoleophilaceae bacterium]